MFTSLVIGYQFETNYISGQIVSRMLHVGTNSKVLAGLRIIQPVLTHNVIGFPLFAMKSGCQEFYLC